MKPTAITLRTCQDLAHRGMAGLWAHPVGMLILALATPAGQDFPWLIWPFTALWLVISIFRGVIQQRLLKGQFQGPPPAYFAMHAVAIMLNGLGWSVLSIILIPAYGVRHWVTSLVLVTIAGISAGGITATTPSRLLLHAYTFLIWIGALVAIALAGAEGWAILMVVVLYNGFLHAQAGRVNGDYRRGVEREQELEEASRAAQASSAAKDRFLANMSHEIRTPMNGILGSLALAMEGRMDAEQRGFLEVARDSAVSLQRLLDDVLDLSKIEAGHVEVERIAFDLPALCVSVGNLLRAAAGQKGVALEVNVAPTVPRFVAGDPTRLRQVLSNLIGNAVKFTAEGHVRVEITSSDGRVSFAVRDTGIGIPSDKQERIFDAFVQADAGTTRRFGGTGLGLAISRHLVRLMGGDLHVESVAGCGSCFSFSLHLPATSVPVDSPSQLAAGDLPSLRILLAEDAAVNQRVIGTMLRRLGQQVEFASDGLQAVQTASQGGFDLILMDVQMPEMNGLEATRAIRQLAGAVRDTPIYGLSANAFASDREQGLEAGMDGYLTKPIAKQDLEAVIANLRAH